MPENFNDRPHKNEKNESIAYVKSLIEQMRTNGKSDDVPKLEKLIQLLNSKKYGLVWEEHAELVEEEMKTKIPVFVEDESKRIHDNPDSEDFNFLLEGDNLHSLHLLEKTHAGKIDVIYIDPPYNTRNSDFKYNDTFVDKEDSFIHSKWLSFMERRLSTAKNLLSKNGVIFISIDNFEIANLRTLMDDIFGNNLISQFIWETDGNFDNMAKVKNKHEYILMYAKEINNLGYPIGIAPDIKLDSKVFNDEIRNTVVKNGVKNPPSKIIIPKGFPAEVNNAIISKPKPKKGIYPDFKSDIVIENNKVKYDFEIESGWSSASMLKKFISNGFQSVVDSKGLETSFTITSTGTPYIIKKRSDSTHITSVIRNVGTTQSASKMLENLNLDFDYPKPTGLVSYLVKMYSKKNSTILDFFAGSGTTGQAVTELNSEDGGTRKFILATNNENNIAEEITYERMKRVSSGTEKYEAKPLNLKYFKTDFVIKEEFPDVSLEYELLKYITPLAELEFAIDIINPKVQIVLNEDQLESLIDNNELISNSTLFMHPDVFRDTEQNQILTELQIKVQEIPNYFFGKEMWSK